MNLDITQAKKTNKNSYTSLNISKEVVEKLNIFCKKRGLKKSAFTELLILAYIKSQTSNEDSYISEII